MATATSRRAAPAAALIKECHALCAELIAIEREVQPRATRAAAIEARLKKIADNRGESFKVTFPSGDFVYVSPPCAAEFKGDVPVLQTVVWQNMNSGKRQPLIKLGLIKIEAQWGRASNGRVQVKVF
jgi:hypothetical protein